MDYTAREHGTRVRRVSPAADPTAAERARIVKHLQRSVGRLSTASLKRMEADMPWVAQLSAHDRSLIGSIVQAGIRSFVEWYRDPAVVPLLRAEVFGAAPTAFAGVITLQQTVELVRLSIEVVEENLLDVVGEADVTSVRSAIDSYAREVAFATAEVYARAAEQRGAWDARLEALVIDAALRGGDSAEDLGSRASALGWSARGRVVVVVGGFDSDDSLDRIRRFAHERRLDCLCSVQGRRLVVLLGGVGNDATPAQALAPFFADGPVVIGPVTASLDQAHLSAAAALAGLRASRGWAEAPRPVEAGALLAERSLNGDETAREELVHTVYDVLAAGDPVLLQTVSAYLAHGSSIEGTARALFVHANTVRYRLRRVDDLTGLNATHARDAHTLRIALTLGRLAHNHDRDSL